MGCRSGSYQFPPQFLWFRCSITSTPHRSPLLRHPLPDTSGAPPPRLSCGTCSPTSATPHTCEAPRIPQPGSRRSNRIELHPFHFHPRPLLPSPPSRRDKSPDALGKAEEWVQFAETVSRAVFFGEPEGSPKSSLSFRSNRGTLAFLLSKSSVARLVWLSG